MLKTYDPGYAREIFGEMDDDAQSLLWNALEIEKTIAACSIEIVSNADIVANAIEIFECAALYPREHLVLKSC